jgi:hypothetical protein
VIFQAPFALLPRAFERQQTATFRAMCTRESASSQITDRECGLQMQCPYVKDYQIRSHMHVSLSAFTQCCLPGTRRAIGRDTTLLRPTGKSAPAKKTWRVRSNLLRRRRVKVNGRWVNRLWSVRFIVRRNEICEKHGQVTACMRACQPSVTRDREPIQLFST